MIGGPRRKPRGRIDDFTAFQQMLSDDDPDPSKDSCSAFPTHSWVQRVYRRVVGTKRHETTGIVPVEMTAKEIKKHAQRVKKRKESNASPEGGTATADELCISEVVDQIADGDEEVEEEEDVKEEEAESSAVPKIKLKTRKYRWDNTNKLLNVEIDKSKEERQQEAKEAAPEGGQSLVAKAFGYGQVQCS